ncbi:hypothetical protein QQF64_027144 [Cirrhinus molitorella]|uniref:Uncharacterized protein n=1 Tax=Cirrhinus molitorella TaxID=172907 RepID=A0ABR3NCC2_9TELE
MAYFFGTKLEWVLPQETCETHWEQVLHQKTWQAQTFSVENQWDQVLPQGTWQTQSPQGTLRRPVKPIGNRCSLRSPGKHRLFLLRLSGNKCSLRGPGRHRLFPTGNRVFL